MMVDHHHHIHNKDMDIMEDNQQIQFQLQMLYKHLSLI